MAGRTSTLPLRLRLLLCLPAFLTTALAQEAPGPLYPIARKLKTGFIDRQGKVVIEPRFDPLSPDRPGAFRAADPLYPVAENLKWGYIDRTGAVRIPFQFSLAGKFREGLAPVRLDSQENGLWRSRFGYVDTAGKLAIAATFDQAGPFSEGLALVTNGSLSGYIDKTGAWAVPARFAQLMDHTSTFSEGLAAVTLAPAPVVATGEAPAAAAAASPAGSWGYIDKRGAWVIPPRYRTASPFRGGVALVTGPSGYVYIGRSGEPVAGPYRAAWEFSGGLGRIETEDGTPAFVRANGQVAFTLPKSVLFVDPFSSGLAKAWVRDDSAGLGRDKYGYIDTEGQFAIPPIYDGGSAYDEGLAFVAACGQSGYIDASNRPVWGIASLPATMAPAASRGLPDSRLLTAARLAALAGIAGGVTVRAAPDVTPGACGPFGRTYWAVAVKPMVAGSFPDFMISLLEGGTYLSEERIGTSAEMARRFGGNSGFKAIGPADRPLGYVTVPGFGPGGMLVLTSVFSPDRRYEVQAFLGLGEGIPPMTTDPAAWSERVALGVRALLFSNPAAPARTAPRPRARR